MGHAHNTRTRRLSALSTAVPAADKMADPALAFPIRRSFSELEPEEQFMALRKTKRLLQTVIGLLFAAGFLYYSLRNIEPAEIIRELGSVSFRYLPLMLFLLAVVFTLKAVRWSLLLRPVRPLSAREVFPALMVGFMGNNVLPAHLGEFIRMFVLAKEYGLSKTAVLSTIVLERVLDFLTMVAFLAFSLSFIPLTEDLEKVRLFGYLGAVVCMISVLLVGLYVWQTEFALRWTEKFLFFAPRSVRNRIMETLRVGIPGLGSLRAPRLLLLLAALSVIHWVANGFCLYLAVLSFPLEKPLSPLAALLLTSITSLGIALPSAPGYVGTTQACFRIALAAFGVSAVTAFSASVYSLVVGWVTITVAGLFFAWRLGIKLRTIDSESE